MLKRPTLNRRKLIHKLSNLEQPAAVIIYDCCILPIHFHDHDYLPVFFSKKYYPGLDIITFFFVFLEDKLNLGIFPCSFISY